MTGIGKEIIKEIIRGAARCFFIVMFTFGIIANASASVSADCNGNSNAAEINVVPQPNSMTVQKGSFAFSSATKIIVPEKDTEAAYIKYFINAVASKGSSLLKPEGKSLSAKQIVKLSNCIVFQKVEGMEKEEYSLEVKPSAVVVKFSSPNGAFYAVQTLLQLMPNDTMCNKSQSGVAIPCVSIKDKPRFKYRGVHLCVGSHVFSTDFIKQYIDVAARYKMNVFHWHLTEDQGWRLEIKKYPVLTEKGSIRKETVIGSLSSGVYDGTPYGGFYTQEQVKEIVKYAAERYVTVIPEIEMPGHALGALHCFPELSCDSTRTYEVATKWGIFKDVYCPSEKTFKFLEDVLTEVFEMFPSEYIHIGGDECPKKAWKNSKFCQDLIKKLGLKDEFELQSYFIQRIEKFVNAHGRKIIGWDEILQGGLAPNATVMSWLGEEGGIKAAKQHHDAVMTPHYKYYLDYYQANPDSEPLSMGSVNTLKDVYMFEPVSPELKPDERKYIIGVQGCLWTEYVTNNERAWYQAYPRTLAIAESGWTQPENKDWQRFTRKVEDEQLPLLDKMGVKYCKAFFDVYLRAGKDCSTSKVVTMELDAPDAEIRYTTDGSEPAADSQVYRLPFSINKQTVVKARGFRDGKPIGETKSVGW